MISKYLAKNKLFFLGLAIAFSIAFLDLLSKNLVFAFLDTIATEIKLNGQLEFQLQYPALEITSFFNLVQVWNKGVSFGMLNNLAGGKYIILSVNLLILLVLLIWLYRNKITYLTWAISLIIGGALGNIADRIQNHAVADFLDFHLFGYHWPAFNLADSAIFLGVALLLLENYFIKTKK